MKIEGMDVIGPDGELMRVEPGDDWILPYRGSRYAVRKVERKLRVVWAWRDVFLPTSEFTGDLIRAVREHKPGDGSFRITAHGAVITKIPADEDGCMNPLYVGRYTGDLEFPGIDCQPVDLELGMHWTGFPFDNGERWSVSPYPQARKHLQWRYFGNRLMSTRPYPELTQRYLAIRPGGGRLYMTEMGHVWMNLPDAEVAAGYRPEFRAMQTRQVDDLVAEENLVLLQLLRHRQERARGRPVYLGHISEYDHGEAPWTSFSHKDNAFGGARNDTADDYTDSYGA